MPFYLSEYIGSGTHQDPFRPAGSDQAGWSAIDLRPDSSRLDGGGLNACLLRVPSAFNDPAARFLADDKLESLTNQQKNFLQNKLGVDLSSPTLLRDIIATLLTAPPANGWKALKPGRLRWEIWLGELLWEAPRISGGSSDNFNRANETPVAAPWTQHSGTTCNIVSNEFVQAGAGGTDTLYYYAGSASTTEQFAQQRVKGSGHDCGPAVRVGGGTGTSAYLAAAAITVLYKFNGGTSGTLGDGFPTVSVGSIVKITAEGSTITGYTDGVPGTPVTDTEISGAGLGAGIFTFDTNGVDDWDGGDITPPASPTAPGSGGAAGRGGLMAVS